MAPQPLHAHGQKEGLPLSHSLLAFGRHQRSVGWPQSRLGICLGFSHEDVICRRVLELVAHEGVSPDDRVGGSEGGLDVGASVASDTGTGDLGCHMSHRKQGHDDGNVELGAWLDGRGHETALPGPWAVLSACEDVQSSWYLPLSYKLRAGCSKPREYSPSGIYLVLAVLVGKDSGVAAFQLRPGFTRVSSSPERNAGWLRNGSWISKNGGREGKQRMRLGTYSQAVFPEF